ncbi:MAG: succinate dehydrogenase, cytochrome b556 subunit [Caedibacter sp. 38-128]|nr:succinate dehydrogenase, cytochrome b556 subunit [Holosporales bacterium]OJX08518.1 MAG: succinate dehydrogenase, cytochrome b556 subunit [Caedibacter sp. 38-128]
MMPSKRPLSPHLQIYKPQLTSVLSVMHRFTGAFLCLGILGIILWLYGISSQPACFSWLISVSQNFIGKVFIFLMLYAFFYHLANGVRHLVWDAGYGFEIKTVYRTGWLVVGSSLGLALLYWVLFQGGRDGF